MSVGKRISELRKQRGFTQEYVAEQLGVSRQAVSKWESDISLPNMENMVKISTLLDVSLDDIIQTQEKNVVSLEYLEQYAYERLEKVKKIDNLVRSSLNTAMRIIAIFLFYSAIFGVCYALNYLLGQPIYIFAWIKTNHVVEITFLISVVLFLLKLPNSCIGLCIGTVIGIILGHFAGLYARMITNVTMDNRWVVYLATLYTGGLLGLVFDRRCYTGTPWKKTAKIAFSLILCVVLFISVFRGAIHIRTVYGANVGYDVGYALGQSDAANGYELYASAHPQTDFSADDPACKGFLLWWSTGYLDGYNGVPIPKRN